MAERKNIFAIGRRGHKGDENQLTEMLAFLFQQEPELVAPSLAALGINVDRLAGWDVATQQAVQGGFLDLTLSVPGEALVIVESKLGATTDREQLRKYIRHAKRVPASTLRALVLITRDPHPWPPGVSDEAGEDVRLVSARWQAIAPLLRQRAETFGHDFAEMLETEGLVTPEPLIERDWKAWHAGNNVVRRLEELLNEARPELEGTRP